MQKRFLSMLLCMSMLFSLLPIGISAEGLEDVLQAGAVQTEDADIQVNRDDLDVPSDPEDQTDQSGVVLPPDTEEDDIAPLASGSSIASVTITIAGTDLGEPLEFDDIINAFEYADNYTTTQSRTYIYINLLDDAEIPAGTNITLDGGNNITLNLRGHTLSGSYSSPTEGLFNIINGTSFTAYGLPSSRGTLVNNCPNDQDVCTVSVSGTYSSGTTVLSDFFLYYATLNNIAAKDDDATKPYRSAVYMGENTNFGISDSILSSDTYYGVYCNGGNPVLTGSNSETKISGDKIGMYIENFEFSNRAEYGEFYGSICGIKAKTHKLLEDFLYRGYMYVNADEYKIDLSDESITELPSGVKVVKLCSDKHYYDTNGICKRCGAPAAAKYEGEFYNTLSAAASAACMYGGIINVLTDLSEKVYANSYSYHQNLTIDLNGKTLSAPEGGIPLTVFNGNIELTNGKVQQGHSSSFANYAIEIRGGNLIVGENVYIKGSQAGPDKIYPAVHVESGSVSLSEGDVLIYGISMPDGTPIMNCLPSGTAFVKYDWDTQQPTDEVINGTVSEYTDDIAVKAHTHSFTGGTCACGRSYAARIGEGESAVCYETLEAAYNAAKNNDTIVIESDLSINGDLTFNLGKNVNFDLNGKKIDLGDGNVLTFNGIYQNTIKGSGYISALEGTVNAVKLQGGTYGKITALHGLSNMLDTGYTFKDKDNNWITDLTSATTLTEVTVAPIPFRINNVVISTDSAASATDAKFYTGQKVYVKAGLEFDEDCPAIPESGISLKELAVVLPDGSRNINYNGTYSSADKTVVWEYTIPDDDNSTVGGYSFNLTVMHSGMYVGKNTSIMAEKCNHSFTDGVCTICGSACKHTNISDDGICQVCGLQHAASLSLNGSTSFYANIADAFAEAQKPENSGCTVKLLKNIANDENDSTPVNIIINTGDFTFDLNGKAFGYYGNIVNLDLCGGKMTLVSTKKQGILYGKIFLRYTAELYITDEFRDDCYINDIVVYTTDTSKEYLHITAPENLYIRNLYLYGSGLKFAFSGGRFGSINSENETSGAELLADGYIFKTHKGEYLRNDQLFRQSNATFLNSDLIPIRCPHADAVDDKCMYCSAKLAGSIGDYPYNDNRKYYTDINEVFSGTITSDEYVTVIGDSFTSSDDIIIDGAKVNYSAIKGKNGKLSFADGKSLIVKNGGSLNVADGYIGTVTLEDSGYISVSGNSAVDILKIIDGNGIKNKLQNGTYGKIEITDENCTLSDLISSSLTLRHTDGTWASDEELSKKVIENVMVVSIPFYNERLTPSESVQTYSGSNSVTLTAEKDDLPTYTGDTAYKWFRDGVELTGETEYEYTDSNLTEAREYEYKCQITREGYSKTVSCKVTVNKADLVSGKLDDGADYEPPAAIDRLEYNGKDQILHMLGSVKENSGYIIEYTATPDNEESWSTSAITGKNANDAYTVYYKVIGDKNHNSTEPQLIDSCKIAKMPLVYTVKYKTKTYDGTTDAEYESVEFNRHNSPENKVYLNPEDYTVVKAEFDTPDADYHNRGKSTLTLNETDNAKNYTIYKETVLSGGIILPVLIEGCHDLTLYIRYNDTSEYAIEASEFGTPNDNNTYEVWSANDSQKGSEILGTGYKIDGKIHFKIKDGLTSDDAGKVFTVKVKIESDDRNYCTNQEYRDTLEFKIVLTDRYIPVLSANPITAVYNGSPVPNESIKGTATYNTNKVDGTWSFKTGAPTNVSDSKKYTVVFTPSDSNLYQSAEADIDVTIQPKDISSNDITVSLDSDSFIYNGSEQKPTVTVKMNDTKLTENADYTVEYPADMTNAGAKEIKINGIGNFSGNAAAAYSVQKNTHAPEITFDNASFTYDGTAKEPSVTVKVDGITLNPQTDYDFSYSDNTNAGTASVNVIGKGNYEFSAAQSFVINKAKIVVKPKNTSKVYGETPVFELESDNNLITAAELAEFTKSTVFTSDGTAANAPANENGYAISAQLTSSETDNLILEVGGTGTLTVAKAPLTIKVKDVSREYGAENPALEVEYSGFVNGEDESVLSGELKLSYDSSINGQTAVDTYTGVTSAAGLTSGNYEIAYVNGNVEITKISISASAGAVGRTYITVVLDREIEGLTKSNFVIKDSSNRTITLAEVIASADNKSYILSGSFAAGTEYTVDVVLSGAAADATHDITSEEFTVTTAQKSSGGGGGGSAASVYTVKFETNGGSKVANITAARNTAAKEPEAPTKDGYDFAGWYTDSALKTKCDWSAKVTKNITLYAAWTEKAKDNTINQIILTIGEKTAQVFGVQKTNDVAPKIVNDRTMLPVRFVAENMGAKVDWDEANEIVTISGKNFKTGEDITILINIDSDTAYINGKEVKLDSPAFIENDRTYTPIRFISEELGADVEWFENTQRVVITKP